ncbi:glycosyltransferase [Solirubrobacter soli]|uniref:glycosyltransferase n=1 Tax=Solirubrobacter soli TaxID=363832 RepID=UPI001B7F9CDE|nr:nucleotide disphospho-sugar-binding domain-containing protein [Solirubrobacter soli]
MRVLLGAFGDPGHAFPIIALGSELVARGHDVGIETWRKWQPHCEAAGMTFAAAPEYQVFPTREVPLKPYEAAVRAAVTTREFVRSFAPDVVVSDILTCAPALAAELEDVPVATVVPHVFPDLAPGLPPFSIGARRPRTRVGARLWGIADRAVALGLEQGRVEYNDARARLGLAPLPYVHTGLSRSLTLVATLPQLEYPRSWPSWCHVVGPLLWEPGGPLVEPVAGSDPVVLVAPSTSQDPSGSLVRACLEGLADEPVRVIAIGDPAVVAPPANAIVVSWMSYARTMPRCDLVVTHGGHGTLARALVSGCPVLVVPAGGDMAENAARVDWAGVGVRLAPRFCTPWGVRLAVRRALSRPALRTRTASIASWSFANPGPARAAAQLERWAATIAAPKGA